MVTHFTNKAKQTAETTATIVRVDSEVETDTDGLETRYYYPVIEYKVDDKTYENRLPDSGSSNSTEYKVGDSVTITYNPENPNELSKKGKVQLVGFGTFETRKRAARTGRNPQTGKELKIAAATVPAFKAGKALKEKVNKK